jgi:hypothetical protein
MNVKPWKVRRITAMIERWSVIGATVETDDRSGGASVALRFGVWRMAPDRLPIARSFVLLSCSAAVDDQRSVVDHRWI